ncbi:hypothetical protein [Chryseobacterium salviniae]|uniref:Lipoprotein n=1 Tax=Chryseobacterium salviniae TaxID=3101750 RepID=A0ABU6HM74_9FLAO|nr:hypothetical protein [Chryseobacterium sp. T9W2-O]MEC3874156.1 hypothetical protein [Chryseobacterium sp. T9W2-O]
MKNLFLILFIASISAVSCSKKEPQDLYPEESPKANYDTMAIDSFSAGAISVDVAEQIRKSSQKYQDSVREALKLQEQEAKIKEELEKEIKKKAEEEKKQKTSEITPSNDVKKE